MTDSEVQTVFEKIYASNAWGHGSGAGSMLRHTRGYLRFLRGFLREKRIKSVVDMGCGDWQFSRYVDWSGITYDGFDVVSDLVAHHRAHFATPNVRFHAAVAPSELPAADLLIVKDVLQHWSDARIFDFIPTIRRYKYALITNSVNPHGPTEHRDIQDGAFRYIDLRNPPYSLNLRVSYTFTNHRGLLGLIRVRWRKHVMLHEGQGPTPAP